jgi:hypothetical protein
VWDSFESAYERAIGDDGSWLDLLRMLIFGVSRIGENGDGGRRGTVLVNASSVGGFRDEGRREAITVII